MYVLLDLTADNFSLDINTLTFIFMIDTVNAVVFHVETALYTLHSGATVPK